MAKEIKQRIVLEGEREYNRAINEAKRNLKTLRSELKAETAELGANATAQQKNEARAKSLKEQIKEQEKIVQTLREALKEAQKEYGDNADVVATWEQKLNDARATLGNMKNDLERAGDGFKTLQGDAAQTVVATKSVADSLDKVGESAGKVADSIQGIFTTVLDKVTEAASKVWELIAVTAAKANNWTDLASYYGTSASEIQKWNRSIEAAGGSFEDFIAIVNQLTYGGKETSIVNNLGISREDYQDDIEYTLAVLDKLEERKKALSHGDFSQLLEDTFGRKSTTYNWFLSNAYGHQAENGEWISGWRENVEQWGGEGKFGINDGDIQTLNDVYIQMESIDAKWDAIKTKVAAGLGTAALNITTSVSGILDGLAEYMDIAADDPEKDQKRQAALDKIRENMESFFHAVADIITSCIGILNEVGTDLQNSDDPATKLIGDIMVKLSDALEWITNHYHEVVIALHAIFGAWLIMKITALAGQLSSFIANVQTIKTFKNFRVPNTGTGTGTGTGGSGGLGTQTVTNQTVTNETVTNGTVTNETVTNGTVTNETVTNMTVPNEVVTTSNVGTMYVQTMIGGNGMPGSGSGSDGSGYLPGGSGSDGSGYLPDGSGTPGLNGYVPVTLPSGGADMSLPGGETLNLPNVDTVNLPSGEQLNLPSGEQALLPSGGEENLIRLDPSDYQIQPQTPDDGGGGWIEMLEYLGTSIIGTLGALAYIQTVAEIAKSFNETPTLQPNQNRFAGIEREDVLEQVVNGLFDSGLSSEFALKLLAVNLKGGGDLNDLFDYFDYEDPERGPSNWLVDMAGGHAMPGNGQVNDRDVMAAVALMIRASGYQNGDTNNLSADRRNAFYYAEEALQTLYGLGHSVDTDDAASVLREFFKTQGYFDPETGKWRASGRDTEREADQMPVINGVPLSNYSGYVMTRRGSLFNWGGSLYPETFESTWNPYANKIKRGVYDALPDNWWKTISPDVWGQLKTGIENALSKKDAEGLKDIPAGVESGAEKGVKKGLNGMRVEIDGQYAGRILAPYISQEIARDMG